MKLWIFICLAALYMSRKKARDLFQDLTMGEDMQLTDNFAWREFAAKAGLAPEKANARTLQMAKAMAETLEAVRAEIGGLPVSITSGIRTQAEYERLLRAGYNPSKASDHFYAENMGVNPLAAGAADIVSPNMDSRKLFNAILKLKYEGRIRTGQLLLESADGGQSFWVHLANDPRLFLTPEQLARRSAGSINLVAVSTDNGKTFAPVPGGQYLKTA